MSIWLAFPPHWYPYEPPMGIACVCGQLRKQGFEVKLSDLNIEALNYFLSEDYLARPSGKTNLTPSFVHETARAAASLKDPAVSLKDYVLALRQVDQAFQIISERIDPSKISLDAFEMKLPRTSLDARAATEDELHNPFIGFFRTVLPKRLEGIRFVGLSIIGESQLIPGLTLAKMVKEVDPTIHVTVGGGAFTRLRGNVAQWAHLFDFLDAIVLFSGASVYAKLVDAVRRGGDLVTIPNLIYRDRGGQIVTTKEEPFLSDPGLPDYDDFPLDYYFTPGRILPYSLFGGKCYWGKCAFCVHSFVRRTSESGDESAIIADVRRLKDRHQVSTFDFVVDDAVPPRLLERFCDQLLTSGLDITWRTHYRLDHMTDFRKLRQAGCRLVLAGLESGSDRVLALMNKGISAAEMQRCLKAISDSGIWTRISLFFGFPGETIEDALETYRFVFDNKAHIHSSGSGPFKLFRDSGVWKSPERYGITRVEEDHEDLALDFGYEVSKGIGKDAAARLNLTFQRLLRDQYPDFDVWAPMTGTALLKFLVRYGSADEARLAFIKTAAELKGRGGMDR